MVAVMLLAASVGATIRLETQGPDEAEAMTAMVELIAGRFGEQR
jgi:phosphocarrier protein